MCKRVLTAGKSCLITPTSVFYLQVAHSILEESCCGALIMMDLWIPAASGRCYRYASLEGRR